MPMTSSMALYTSSPPTIWSNQGVSATLGFDVDPHCRAQSGQQQASKSVTGGLSSLFAGPLPKFSSAGVCDALDSTCLSNASSGLIRSRSHSDLCSIKEGTDSRCGAMNIPVSGASKTRECSPVSVFQGPSSYGSICSYKLSTTKENNSNCCLSILDCHSGIPRRKYSPSLESLRTRAVHAVFDIDKEQSCSSLRSGALASCIECGDLLGFSDNREIAESLSSESMLVDPGTSPSDNTSSLMFPLEKDSTLERLAKGMPEDGVVSEGTKADRSPVESLWSSMASRSLCESTDTSRLGSSSSSVEDILLSAQGKHAIFKDHFVVKAFKEAEKAHEGQIRASGHPYLIHCAETALLLAAAGAKKTVVVAGLLHDTLDDCSWDQKRLRESFGDDVADLVVGVSRLSEFSQLARDNNTANKTIEADRLRTMFLAMVDVRVVLIKLADRLHNMRTLGALSETKQRRIANETLEIFVPLASRLGIWSWKAEIEDLCFRYLKPVEYQKLKDELAKGSRDVTVMSAIQKLDQALRKEGISFHDLCGRTKSLYGIYSKMIRKDQCIDEICDMQGLRLIVADEDSCYTALEVVHKLWSHVPRKLKDYIRNPKFNGYQSLHTVVIGGDGLPLEVQIRTMDMHHQAEFGMAAHWRYKESNGEHSSYILQRVAWARWVLTWHSEMMDSKLRLSPLEMDLRPPCPFPFHTDRCPHSVSFDGPPLCEDDPVFVIILEDEKMVVRELPPRSTVADLLMRMYGGISLRGNVGMPSLEETGLKVNHEKVYELQQKLQMGDLIEFTPFFTTEVLDECRDKIRRMYGRGLSLEGTRIPQNYYHLGSTIASLP